ncbi:unnamed protein product [Microthlaspi erraticum]|uniref:Uncharacterized protein n=1 Tax=Microthlaspi erraticum TaxID=1685480 RepID=A0A6D2HL94_9BRAS|nr:unnamed protein product [Microthlaspi erraticum]
MSMNNRVLRGNERCPSCRYSPYTSKQVPNFTNEKKKQKEEAARLGAELSLYVAEVMFLLSDDMRSLLRFCYWLLSFVGKQQVNGPVVGRLFVVIEHVFETYIQPKNRVYQDGGKSIQWELVGTFGEDFSHGLGGMLHIVSILRMSGRVSPPGLLYYGQKLKKLEDKLTCARHISEANGFAKEAIQPYIVNLWKSLLEPITRPPLVHPMVRFIELLRPLSNEKNKDSCCSGLASLRI